MDAAHALAVGAEHGDRADVVQHVLRGNGLGADAAFGERHVFGNSGVEVVAHHRHVEMLVESVHRVGIGRIGRRRQAIGDAGDANDVGRVAAAGAFGVIHVDRAAADGGERILDEAGFVERIGVQLHLKIEVVGDGKASVDRRRHRAPVFVNLQADAAGFQLLDERSGLVRIAASEETEIDRPMLGGLQHLADIERTAGVDADGDRAERAAEHRGDARRDRVLAQPGRVEMHVHVDGAGRGDHTFAIAHRGRRRDEQARIDAVHDGGIAGLAEADDAAVLDAEIAFDDADHRIDDEDVAEQEVERALRAGHAGGEPDAVAQRLAAAMQAFVAVDGVILLDDGDQRGIGQADAVADRRAIEGRIVPACDRDHGRSLTRP